LLNEFEVSLNKLTFLSKYDTIYTEKQETVFPILNYPLKAANPQPATEAADAEGAAD
jgi:hypothetical protein